MPNYEAVIQTRKVMLKNAPEVFSRLAEAKRFNFWPIYNSDSPFDDWNGIDYLVGTFPCHRGSMSQIYKAWDFKKDIFVAVKTLHDVWQQNTKYKRSIELEAETLQRINHPGIPKIYGITYDSPPERESSPKMIMEYIEEESLEKRLNSSNPLTISEIIETISQVGSTIDYLSSKHNLFHGDINPNQILMSKPFKKLVDFSMSTAVSSDGDAYTPGFSAPERQLNKTRNLSTEEFSLAAIAYNIITDGVIDINIKIFDNPKVIFTKISKMNLKYDLNELDIKRLNEILEKALATDPEQRYKSASEFADKFAEVIKNAKGLNKSFSHKAFEFAQRIFSL